MFYETSRTAKDVDPYKCLFSYIVGVGASVDLLVIVKPSGCHKCHPLQNVNKQNL